MKAVTGLDQENALNHEDEIVTKKRIKLSSQTKKKAERQGPDVLPRTEALAVADRFFLLIQLNDCIFLT